MERLGVVRLAQWGFGAMVAMLLAQAVVTWATGAVVSSSFKAYKYNAGEAVQASALLDDLGRARIAVFQYRAEGDPAALEKADAAMAALLERSAQIVAGSTGDIAAAAAEAQEDAGLYRATLEQVAQLGESRDEALTALVTDGDALSVEISRIAAALSVSGDVNAAYIMMQAKHRFELARTQVERYLSGLADTDIAAVADSLAAGVDALRRQADLIADIVQGERLVAAADSMEAFAAQVAGAHASGAAIARLYDETLDVVGPRMQRRIDATVDMIVARQARLGPQAASKLSLSLVLSTIAAVVAIAAGAALAFIVSRRASATLGAITDSMTGIANGDLDTQVRGRDLQNEIGDMARALVAFRDAARTERKEAAEGRARAEAREAFQEAFARVANASTRGDFSGRIEARFPIDELNTLADSVNALMQTVADGVRETGAVVAALAEGDLSRRMNGRFAGAFAELQRNVNATMEKLETLIGAIAASSAEIDGATGEIAAAARDVSARAEQQAASLEETAAAMEQMSANVRSSADNADRAKDLANDAAGRADKGRAVVGDATAAMDAIQASSSRIADIVGAIDSIAFTTNLLALNASVEAARAGEAGKGFAVVAGEVRTLAQRSAESAREIRELIDGSVSQVESGAEKVRQTERALGAIAESVVALNGAISEISAGMREQAAGIGEVTTAVTGMDQITQSNAAQAEQSAASAASLADLSRKLRSDVAAFAGARRGYAHAAE